MLFHSDTLFPVPIGFRATIPIAQGFSRHEKNQTRHLESTGSASLHTRHAVSTSNSTTAERGSPERLTLHFIFLANSVPIFSASITGTAFPI